MSLETKLDQLIACHKALSDQLAVPETASSGQFGTLSKDLSDLDGIVETALALRAARQELIDTEALLKDADAEMKALAEEEKQQLHTLIPRLEHELRLALLPKDEADERNAILEVRAGTGGEEAALEAYRPAREPGVS